MSTGVTLPFSERCALQIEMTPKRLKGLPVLPTINASSVILKMHRLGTSHCGICILRFSSMTHKCDRAERKDRKGTVSVYESRSFLQHIDCPGQKIKLGHYWLFVALLWQPMIASQ